MFKWKKRGLIWSPSLENSWMQEYGQNPNALVLADRIRIYFSSRRKDIQAGGYISFIFFIDVDKEDPSKILKVQDVPLLNANGRGLPGEFDEYGTMPGSLLLRDNNEIWLYYVGWSRTSDLPYKWANGIAISKDGGSTFQKLDNNPLMTESYTYPYLHACPRVYQHKENDWSMWFASGIEWSSQDNQLHPIYVLMKGKSRDGIHWHFDPKPTISSVRNKECQSSASIIYLNNRYHMFFSYRDVMPVADNHKQYRIGYASSDDLVNWHRADAQAGIDVSSSGWDSQAICYPHVVNVNDKIYMFYSGNQYGCAGFGYAELVEFK